MKPFYLIDVQNVHNTLLYSHEFQCLRSLCGPMIYVYYGLTLFLVILNSLMIVFQPKAVFFTCIDSRMLPTRFTQTNVGDMFIGEFRGCSQGRKRPGTVARYKVRENMIFTGKDCLGALLPLKKVTFDQILL